MTIAERVARRFQANGHEKLLGDFAKIMTGPKISDSKLCQTLGITLNEGHALANEWRGILGISSMVRLRDALKQRH